MNNYALENLKQSISFGERNNDIPKTLSNLI